MTSALAKADFYLSTLGPEVKSKLLEKHGAAPKQQTVSVQAPPVVISNLEVAARKAERKAKRLAVADKAFERVNLKILREMEDVADRYGLTVADIRAGSRSKAISKARQQIWVMLRVKYEWSYPQIGKLFGTDHSSVMHGIKQAKRDNCFSSP
jgi:chromosomal replication initiation ATPase DnaA